MTLMVLFFLLITSICFLQGHVINGHEVHFSKLKKVPVNQLIQSDSKKLNSNINQLNIPLYFIQNKGQVNKKVLFYSKTPGYTLWLTKEGLVFDSVKTNRPGPKLEWKKSNKESISRDITRMFFVGSNKNPEVISLATQQLKVNSIKGNNRSKWFGNIPTTASVLYKDLYSNIDLKIYGNGNQIEYDWIIHPGGDPGDIQFEFKNLKGSRIISGGDLEISTSIGRMAHKKPVAFQAGSEKKSQIPAEFIEIGNNRFGFHTGEFNRSEVLVIDPLILQYSSYIGSTFVDQLREVESDDNGIAFIVGFTYGSDFPVHNEYSGTLTLADIIVMQVDMNQSGVSSLLYCSYFGGSNLDFGYDIAIDNYGCCYITGMTASGDFPSLNSLRSYSGNWDAFAAKFDPSQSGANSLIWSTCMGGSDYDEGRGIKVNLNGEVYLIGVTESIDFPAFFGYQMTYQGGWDIFFVKFQISDSGISAYDYSTYLGGTGYDYGLDIDVDSGGNAYISGYSTSSNFPALNQYQGLQGGTDIIITKFDPSQRGVPSLLYSTYLGGSGDDEGHGITADDNGVVHVTGSTESTDFPLINPFQGDQTGNDAFLAKVDTNSSGTSSLQYSSYLGGNGGETGRSLDTDLRGYIYISGITNSSDFPLINNIQGYQGGSDAFLSKFDTRLAGSSSLLLSTCVGGSSLDYAMGISVDTNYNIYITGFTTSSDFPLLNPYQNSYQGNDDGFLSKLVMECNISASVSGGNGIVSPTSQTVNAGQNGSVFITPDQYYQIDTITDNGDAMHRSNPFIVRDVQEDHSVVVTFKHVTYKIKAAVSEGEGSVFPEFQTISYGDDAIISIVPAAGFKISSIIDNGNQKNVITTYIMKNVQDDHSIDIKFSKIINPPILILSGQRKSEKAWILSKDYSELKISITEHQENPAEVDSYILLKSEKGNWTPLKNYTPGDHSFIDKEVKKDQKLFYVVRAIAPDGIIVSQSNILEL